MWSCRQHIHSEHGIATHYVPSNRIPQLLEALSSVERPDTDDKQMSIFLNRINATIEIFSSYEKAKDSFFGDKRVALDLAFRHNSVKQIFESLEGIPHILHSIVFHRSLL